MEHVSFWYDLGATFIRTFDCTHYVRFVQVNVKLCHSESDFDGFFLPYGDNYDGSQ